MTFSMLFDGWGNLGRVLTVGVAAYLIMVIELRIAGQRTLAKLNAFDLVVTVALGSVLATIALSRDVSLTEGAAAITLLVSAQWVAAWLSVHVTWARRIVRADATVMFADGHFVDGALRRARLSHGDIEQAIRAAGSGDLERVAAVVLESDGSLSVVDRERCDTGTALPIAPANRSRDTPHTAPVADRR